MKKFNLHNKKFRITLIEGENTEVNEETVFEFQQDSDIVWAVYKGGMVKHGQLVGTLEGNKLHHGYVQVNLENEISSGRGNSKLEINENDKIEIIEQWKWDNRSGSGKSVMTEL